MTRRSLNMLIATSIASIALAAAFVIRSQSGSTTAHASAMLSLALGPALEVDAIRVSPIQRYEVARRYTGVVETARSSDLGFERIGRVISVVADEGDRVREGEVLAQLNVDQLLARHRQLEADRNAATAVLAELQAGPRQEVIASAQASLEDYRAQLGVIESKFQRRQRLHGRLSGAVSEEELEQTGFGVDAARSRVQAAQHQLDELVAGTRVEKVQAQQALIDALQAAAEAVLSDIEHSTLRAPFDGAIVSRQVDEGSIVAPGMTILQIIEDGRLQVRVGLPVDAIRDVAVGDQIDVIVDAATIPATVSAIVGNVNRETYTKTLIADIASLGTPNVITPGEIARVALNRTVETSAAYWLPTTALLRSSHGLWSCFAVEMDDAGDADEGNVSRQEVEVLHVEGDRVLVRGTLQQDTIVIPVGTDRVTDGQRVRVPAIVLDAVTTQNANH